MQLPVELHKAANGQFYTTIMGLNNETTHDSEIVKNRVDVLDTIIGVAANFGGYWDGWYEDHTGKKPVDKRHPVEERGAKLNIILPGMSLIAKERQSQLSVHLISVGDDVTKNKDGQLAIAAGKLLKERLAMTMLPSPPKGWKGPMWDRLIRKPYGERVVIAGALLAAEKDRLRAIDPPLRKQPPAKKSAPKKRSTPTYKGHIDNPLNVR